MYSINKVNNNKVDIQIVKGNTFREQIAIKNDARLSYVPCAGDDIIFSVFNKYTDANPIFEKKIPYDTLVLELTAKETSRMRIGDYVYKIRLVRMNTDTDDFLHGSLQIVGVID